MNNAVKLLLRCGYWIEPKPSNSKVYWLCEENGPIARFYNAEEPTAFAGAMSAPTPREQELEAQNKALWELVWKADDALQGMVSLITVNTVAGGKIPSIFADDTRVAWAIEAREAIQKAKEAR